MAFPRPGLRPDLFVYNNKQGTIMKRIVLCALIGATGLTLTACKDKPFNAIPDFIQGDINQSSYDGMTDDLLTAGLGASGLGG